VTKGSCILFCSGDYGNKGVLAVDTIFWVSEGHQWVLSSKPPCRYSRDVENQTDLWNAHLRFGGQPGHHPGKYTYEAALYPQPGGRYSRLPLDEKGARVQVTLTTLSAALQARIADSLRGRRPVLISGADLRSILELLDDQTATAVVGNIVPNDDTFTGIRIGQGTDCPPCRPEVSKTCCLGLGDGDNSAAGRIERGRNR
jgi:hypothetical protein